MMCLALLASDASDTTDGLGAQQQRAFEIELCREKVVRCLTAGQYTKTGPYVLETMANNLYVEFIMHPDANRDA